MAENTHPQTDTSTAIFLSYSRKDGDFVRRLADALDARGYAPIFDKSERLQDDPNLRLTAQDEWWTTLKSMIAACEVMVFIVTPDSAASPVCDDEIAYARGLGKRIIAVLRRSVDFDAAPERLRALHVSLDFCADDQAAFEAAFHLLCNELEVDIGWYRNGARLARLADQWTKDGRPDGQLLRAQAVEAADAWALRCPHHATPPGELLLAFLDASREFEGRERDRQRRVIGRAFVKPALQAVADGRHDHALRLIATGALLADDLAMRAVGELWMVGGLAIASNRTRAVLRGHIRSHVRTSFSADGKLVLTASADGTACVWDANSGAALGKMEHANSIESASFSHSGQSVVTADGANVAVWEARTGGVMTWLDSAGADIACFAPNDDKLLISCGDGAAIIWCIKSGSESFRLRSHGQTITAAAFSADGRRVVTGYRDGSCRVWDAAAGAQIAKLNAHADIVTAASFGPDGEKVLTGSKDGTVRVWHAKTGNEFARFLRHTGAINAASFSMDGRRIVTGSEDGTARVWNAANGMEIACVTGHGDSIATASFSPDGRRLVTGSWNVNADTLATRAPSYTEAIIWDADTGIKITRLAGHDDGVCSVSFSPDGRRIVTGSEDGVARVWDAHSGPERAKLTIAGANFTSAAFSADGASIVTGLDDGTARIWDAATLLELAQLRGHSAAVTAASFRPDGKRIVTASKDGTACIWDVATRAAIIRFSDHKAAIVTASYSPDGTRVVTGAEDGTARVWNAESASGIAHFVLDGSGSVTTASFAPDGRSILSTENIVNKYPRSASIWDADDGREIARLESPLRSLWSASLSPDGGRVAVIGGDKHLQHLQTVSVLDAKTGNELTRLQCRNAYLNSACFSPDGGRIVTASNPVGVFDAETGAEIARLEGHAGRVNTATFSPDGRFVVTTSVDDHSARIWDISNTEAICRDRGVAIVAALSSGLGKRSSEEANDLLMEEAPDDLFVDAKNRLGSDVAHQIESTVLMLRAPLHDDCYLSPTQAAEKFGQARSENRSGAGDVKSRAATGPSRGRHLETKAQRKWSWPFTGS